MKTIISKNHYGNWQARSTTMISADRQLTILTSKNSNGTVSTVATVGKCEGSFISHTVFQDFSKTLSRCIYKRVTKNVIEQQHNETDFQAVIAEAKAFYNITE